ncbi:MAG: GtrA family protein [Acidimicrobiales bacterium]
MSPPTPVKRPVPQPAKFVAVGFSNAVIDLAVFNALLFANPTRYATTLVAYNTVAVVCAILNSYIWNTRWTFRAQAATSGARRTHQMALFVLQSVVNIAVNDAVLGTLASLLELATVLPLTLRSNLAKLAAMFFASMTSFVVMKLVVFKPESSRFKRLSLLHQLTADEPDEPGEPATPDRAELRRGAGEP